MSGEPQPPTVHPADAHWKEVIEIRIPLPFGHLAAKWWGRRDRQPIVCLHGWQDNAGTFDTLVQMLPTSDVGYLAIDLLGHGRSSPLPAGMMYTSVDDLYTLNYMLRQFGWSSVALIGHSLGAQIACLFASLFPDRVRFVVALDALMPRVMQSSHVEYMRYAIEQTRLADMRNVRAMTLPPTYSYEQLLERLNAQTFLSVSRSSAPYLLLRAVAESAEEPGRYYFTRDARLRTCYYHSSATVEINEALAASIACPMLYVKTSEMPSLDGPEHDERIVAALSRNPAFTMHVVDGEHHVHLNRPELIAGVLSAFIGKQIESVEALNEQTALALKCKM